MSQQHQKWIQIVKDKLKNRVCDVLGIDESWVDLGEQEMNNTAQKVTRIDKDAWDIATELANEYGVSICHIISESVRYCAENAEFKEVDVVVKRLSVGGKVLDQEDRMKEIEKNALNDVLRTIILINGKIEEIAELQKQQEILISYLRGMIAGSESE